MVNEIVPKGEAGKMCKVIGHTRMDAAEKQKSREVLLDFIRQIEEKEQEYKERSEE